MKDQQAPAPKTAVPAQSPRPAGPVASPGSGPQTPLMSLQMLADQRAAASTVAQLQSVADTWVLQRSGKGGKKQEAGKEDKDDKAEDKSPEGAASGKEAVEAVERTEVEALLKRYRTEIGAINKRIKALPGTMTGLTAWQTLGAAHRAAVGAFKSTEAAGATITTRPAYHQADARLRHWVDALKGMVKDLEAQADRDSAYADMNSATYADALGHFALAPDTTDETGRGSGGAALSRIQLYGGGLHSEAIGIIERYYREDFTLDDLLATESEEAILDLLYEDESAKILEEERESGIPQKRRRFYKVDEATKQASEMALRAELRPKAAEQARGRGVTPKASGQLRSWHLNDTGRLPRKVLKNNDIKQGFDDKNRRASIPDFAGQPAATARGLLHDRWLADLDEGGGFQAGYIEAYGTAAKKGGGAADFRRDARRQEPGYIEINAAGWTESKSQGRLLYDYLSDLWYITLDHYHDHFFEIIVPPEVKRLAAGKAEPAGKADAGKTSGASTAPPETAMNNCLLDAIHGAATAAGLAPATLNYAAIRTDLEARGLGDRGTMLYADQQVVERILTHLGINGRPVILYQANGTAQDVGGGGDDAGGQVIQIYHTGALHYVAQPTTPAQIESTESRGK